MSGGSTFLGRMADATRGRVRPFDGRFETNRQ